MQERTTDLAERTLRPTAAQAGAAWRELVEAEKQQVESLPNRPRPEDFYAPVAESFRADPRRDGDPMIERLVSLMQPDETWLDLGAGGGRYTLALALHLQHMYAVEPSEGMLAVLRASARESGIDNLDVFAERWPGASTAPVADVGFMSQVGYDIADIVPFLDQLEAHARRLCVAVLFREAPIAYFAALWQPVHGERRITLPGLPEFMALLYARGRSPQVSAIQLPARVYADVEALVLAARRPLWLLPDTAEDRRLRQAVGELAQIVEGGVTLDAMPRHLSFVTWEPAG